MQPLMEVYPWIQEYSQRKAETPEASPIFASGIFCSSTSAAIDFMVSIEQEVGFEESKLPASGSASLILATGHENSNAKSISLSWSLRNSSLSMNKSTKNQWQIQLRTWREMK